MRGVIKALQTSIMVLLAKIVGNVNLKTSTILAKNLWYFSGSRKWCASADWYITVLKRKTCNDGRQVKMESF